MKKQHLIDLTQLHGWLSDREGWNPRFAEAVALATRAAFPKATLSQAMEADIEKARAE